MTKIKIRIRDKSIVACGLNNEEIPKAIQACLNHAKFSFGDLPLKIQCSTWDKDYGDICPNGWVIIRPDMDAWDAKNRLEKIKDKCRQFMKEKANKET